MIWSRDIWGRSFDLYLHQSQDARPKSAKQLLATLATALRESADDSECNKSVSKLLLAGIRNEDDHGLTKSCLQALALFLGRHVLSLDILTETLIDGSAETKYNATHSTIGDLLFTLFNWVGRCDFASTIGHVVSIVLNQYDQTKPDAKDSAFPVWMEPLEKAVRSNDVPFDDFRIQIMPVVFNRSLRDYTSFLYRHGLQQLVEGSDCKCFTSELHRSGDMELLLAALMTGKEQGLLYETEGSTVFQGRDSILLPLRCIERLIRLRPRSARLAGLSLLIVSRSATRPLPSLSFSILMRRLFILFADTDADFRSEVVSLMQRLMDRLRAATAVLARQSKDDEAAHSTLLEHEAFLKWLLRFLSWELRPTASYQRHISALKTLLVVTKAGIDSIMPSEFLSKSALNETKWPFTISIMTSGLRRQLLDLLMDPFDDVRQISATVLSIYATSYNASERSKAGKELIDVVDRAESTMLATGRADHADGVAHLYRLLFLLSDDNLPLSGLGDVPQQPVLVHLLDRVERMLDAAEASLAVAANKYPLHGLLMSIRYIISQHEGTCGFESLLGRLVACLHRVWEVVRPVLCNDAPEGYIPDNADDLQGLTTKDVLSYSWRALKESSLLLGVIAISKSLDVEGLIELSNLCFAQLAELRHRGAFSTVAQTWIVCCGRCKDLKIAGSNALHIWYCRVLGSLESKTTINTRRSAGLPALICGLLIVDKTGRSTSEAIHDLSAIARQAVEIDRTQESSLPQVHALNCIKDIMKNTRLAEHSERFVSHAFILAAQSLRSQAWAVRNCGLMLFRASIDRLLGTSEAHLDDELRPRQRISLTKQPELLDAIFDLLRSPLDGRTRTGSSGSEGIFPALQLLKSGQVPETRRPEALSAVLHLTASSSWHVRNKAARTYAAIVDENTAVSEFERLLSTKQSSLNSQHGAILCAKHLVIRLCRHHQNSPKIEANSDITGYGGSSTFAADVLYSAINGASHLHHRSACPLIRSAFMEVMIAHLEWVRYHYSNHTRPKAVECHDLVDFAKIERTLGPGESELRRTIAQVLLYELFMGIRSDHDRIVQIISRLGEADADACSSMFKELRALATSTADDSDIAIGVLVTVSSNILRGNSYDIGLKCEVQAFLLSIAKHRLSKDRDAHLLGLVADACEVATMPFSKTSNQLYADQWLQLQAVKLDHRIAIGSSSGQRLRQDVESFVSSCNLAIEQDDSALFTLEAAALALNNIECLWHYLLLNLPRLCLELCFGVYDLLNEDDEDIRQLAAGITSRIIDSRNVQEPLSAGQALIRLMLRTWPTDSRLVTEAIHRAFGIRGIGHITSMGDRLVTSSAMDTALFVEEKQNLYVDDARASRLWSQVIFASQPRAISRTIIRRLAVWVSDGLETLTTRAASEHDGPLGWTTKPDVFLLGLQVVYGAEAILRLAEGGLKVPVRPSILRLKLYRLRQAAKAQGINQLWIAEIERVAAWSVSSRLVLLKRLMNEIVDKNNQ